MPVRDSVIYLLSRVFPAIFSLTSIAILTRFLSPEDYGLYALIVAAATILSTIFFTWNSHAVFRCYAEMKGERQALLTTGFAGFFLSWSIVGLLSLAFLQFYLDDIGFATVAAALLLAGALAWLDLCSLMLNVESRSVSFALLHFARSAVAMAVGGGTAWLSGSPVLVVLFVAAGYFLVGIVPPVRRWLRQVSGNGLRPSLMGQLFRYGLPLSLAIALMQLVGGLDRWMLAWLADKATVAEYSVGFDLAQFTIIAIGSALNLAFYPRLLQTLSDKGEAAAKQQLSIYLMAVLGIVLPAAAGLAMVSPGIAAILIGESLRSGAVSIMPWICASMAFAALKSYYADYAFQLNKWTVGGMLTAFFTLMINAVLNFVLIPRFGALGAAQASAISFVLAFVLSLWLGSVRGFSLPKPQFEHLKPVVATIGMMSALMLIHGHVNSWWLVVQIMVGIVTYALLIYSLNPFGLRKKLSILHLTGLIRR